MNNYLIKICGIKTVEMATLAAKAHANYIGIIFYSASPRHVKLNDAIKISKAVTLSGAKPVAVFVNQNAFEMRAICEATDIKCVQLHGTIARSEHHLLPQDYQRFYVQSELQNEEDGFSDLDKERDFVLIDHTKSHQDITLMWKKLHYDKPYRYFFAGGLTPTNVQTAMTLLRPDGLDVSRGVESTLGVKDISLIQKFINTVRDYDAT